MSKISKNRMNGHLFASASLPLIGVGLGLKNYGLLIAAAVFLVAALFAYKASSAPLKKK